MENDKNDDTTKRYEIKSSHKKTKKKKESKQVNTDKKGKKKKHSKLKKVILILFILFILLCLTGIGVFAGIFFSDKWKINKEDLEISLENTIIYDKDGKQIAELAGDESRKIIPLADMGEYLPNAFIAIEDERYYSHFGIDIKRTAGAIATYITHGGNSSFGGSTITQQLVKNMMQDQAAEGTAGVERKIREWSRAYQIEQMLSKSQILELYLNKIFMGSTVYGVESASEYYFSKTAKELDLAEAAFLAGINHAPNGYNPFDEEEDNSEAIKERTLTVLSQMKKLKNTEVPELAGLTKITDEQYEEAINEVKEGLKFKRGTLTDNSNISFHTAAAIQEIINQISEEKEVNYDTAKYMVYNNGYKIYTTQDSSIQEIMEKEYLKKTYIKKATTKVGKAQNQHSQSAMVIIDHKTGKVVATVGGLGTDSSPLDLNRATSSERQPGSSIKPLVAIAPGIEKNIITASTMYDDSLTYWGGAPYYNAGSFAGIIPVRQGIERSSNIVNMKILANVGAETGVKFANDFGLSSYTTSEEDGDASITLALGGTYHGTNPLEMAAAYATIANGGEYIEPTFYTKVENASGAVVLEPKQEKRRVISEQTAYIVTDILQSPVYGFKGGATAYGCAISGIETAAKTGTTTSYKDKWLCGFTPYYAAATWFGYDEPETIDGIAGVDNPAKSIWSNVMKSVHKGLKKASFKRPSGIVSAKICYETGKVATDKCKNTYSEIFKSGTIPDKCPGHEATKICKESKKLATEFCPADQVEEKNYAIKPETEINANWRTVEGKKYNTIKDTCDIHTEEKMTLVVPDVIGKTETQAKTELAELTVQVVNETDTTKANGVVLKQSVNAGEKVAKKSVIIITVNKISQTPTPPTPDPDTNTTTNEITNTITNTTTNTTTNTATNTTTNPTTNTTSTNSTT